MASSELTDKTIVVTGAGRGFGAVIVRASLALGATVIAVDRDGERLGSMHAALGSDGLNAHRVNTEVCDITDEAGVEALFTRIAAPWGVVNNAALADGVGGLAFWDLARDDWRRVVGVNLEGTWLFSKYAAKSMLAAGGAGRIVNLTSDAAIYGSPRLAHYIASKSGVIGLTRTMARDLGPHNITVNAVAPGLTEGPSAETIPAERHELYARNRALPRTQQLSDIAGAVTFLLSESAAYITGHTLVVDGGFVMT